MKKKKKCQCGDLRAKVCIGFFKVLGSGSRVYGLGGFGTPGQEGLGFRREGFGPKASHKGSHSARRAYRFPLDPCMVPAHLRF